MIVAAQAVRLTQQAYVGSAYITGTSAAHSSLCSFVRVREEAQYDVEPNFKKSLPCPTNILVDGRSTVPSMCSKTRLMNWCHVSNAAMVSLDMRRSHWANSILRNHVLTNLVSVGRVMVGQRDGRLHGTLLMQRLEHQIGPLHCIRSIIHADPYSFSRRRTYGEVRHQMSGLPLHPYEPPRRVHRLLPRVHPSGNGKNLSGSLWQEDFFQWRSDSGQNRGPILRLGTSWRDFPLRICRPLKY